MKRLVSATLLIAILACTALAYSVMLVLSEHRAYSAASVDHLLLTPRLLKNLPSPDLGDARYTYSAADGPKPAISSVSFTTREDRTGVERRIAGYLVAEGFTEKAPGVFSKDGREVQVEYSPLGTDAVGVRITDFDHL